MMRCMRNALLYLLLSTALFTGCKSHAVQSVGPDAAPPPPVKKCSLTPLFSIPMNSNDINFVGLARSEDGYALVASFQHIYKVDPETGALIQKTGYPGGNDGHVIVDLSAAPGQPTLIATGRDLYSFANTGYLHLASAPDNVSYFVAIAQAENQDPLVATTQSLYSFDLSTSQLHHLADSPDGSFFSHISKKPGLPTLVSTQHSVYTYSSGTLTKVLDTGDNRVYVQALAQVISAGFVFASEYDVYVSDAAGENSMTVLTRPNPNDHTYFSSASSAGPDANDILMTSGQHLYRLDLSCLETLKRYLETPRGN